MAARQWRATTRGERVFSLDGGDSPLGGFRRRERCVPLVDIDPDLAAAAARDGHEQLVRRHVVARVVSVLAGEWTPELELADDALGLLVVDGLICRRTSVAEHGSLELVGPGDLIRPSDPPAALVDGVVEVEWLVLRHAELAVLDGPCAERIRRFPALVGALLQRVEQRASSLALQLTISHLVGVDVRLELLMRHIAARWGRVTREGIALPLTMTNDMIGCMIGARRPSVSAAAAKLGREGRLARSADGGWLLPWSEDDDPDGEAGDRSLAAAAMGAAR